MKSLELKDEGFESKVQIWDSRHGRLLEGAERAVSKERLQVRNLMIPISMVLWLSSRFPGDQK